MNRRMLLSSAYVTFVVGLIVALFGLGGLAPGAGELAVLLVMVCVVLTVVALVGACCLGFSRR